MDVIYYHRYFFILIDKEHLKKMRILQTTKVVSLSRLMKSRNFPADISTPSLIIWDPINSPSTDPMGGLLFPGNSRVQMEFLLEEGLETSPDVLPLLAPKLVPNVPGLFDETLREEWKYYLQSLRLANKEPRPFVAFYPLSLMKHPSTLSELLELDPSLVFPLFSYDWKEHAQRFAKDIIELRSRLPMDVGLGLGGLIPPHFFPLLVYLGIDIVDSTWAQWACSQGLVLSPDLKIVPFDESLNHLKSDEWSLCEWNLRQSKYWISLTQRLVSKGQLRDLVEETIHWDPFFASVLRVCDRPANRFHFEDGIPIVGTSMYCAGEESLRRPEISSFHKRVRDRFEPWKYHKLVVILPCSYKKPYFLSQSHQRFASVLNQEAKKFRTRIGKIIVTSPMGAVPGELDLAYPVSHYDIPVTGDWGETEIRVTSTHLAELLNQYSRETIFVVHVSEDYQKMVEFALGQSNVNIFSANYLEKPYLSDGLSVLRENTQAALQLVGNDGFPYMSLSYNKLDYLERFRALSSYYYGKGVGDELLSSFKSIEIRGKYPRDVSFISGGINIGVLSFKTNKLVLSLEAISAVFDLVQSRIVFNGDSLEGSNLFLAGVISASPSIRPDDEVIIVSPDNELLGTGVALLPGRQMRQGKSGIVAKIRKKVKT